MASDLIYLVETGHIWHHWNPNKITYTQLIFAGLVLEKKRARSFAKQW